MEWEVSVMNRECARATSYCSGFISSTLPEGDFALLLLLLLLLLCSSLPITQSREKQQ